MRTRLLRALPLVGVLCAVILAAAVPRAASQRRSFDWRTDWAAPPDFSISIDTRGYDLPTALAFVERPGRAPDDPLYFVTELRGKIKVVTNDRSVHTFADVSTFEPATEYPSSSGDSGLAGICLDDERGYVFVTYTYKDDKGLLRNNISRLGAAPRTFSLEPTSNRAFTDLLAPYRAATSHQIGGCQVEGASVFVSIGDGQNPAAAGGLEELLGKVMCMTVEGRPCPGNPFLGQGRGIAADYTWAYGLRNPFGLTVLGGEVFVAENGLDIDRFHRLDKGQDHYWDGTDASLATDADIVFSPVIAPVQMDHYPAGSRLFPNEFWDHFFIAAAGKKAKRIPVKQGVVTLGYDLRAKKVSEVWSHFVEYRGEGRQEVVGLAFGPDGLYFAPILPDEEGMTAILKVSHDPGGEYPFQLGEGQGTLGLMVEKGCFSCHQLGPRGGGVGPSLDQEPLEDRLEERLFTEEYLESLDQVDRLEEEPFASYRQAREEVREAEGRERYRVWIRYRLLEPKFDDPLAEMPSLGLTEAEADEIRNFLLTGAGGGDGQESLWERAWRQRRAVAAGFAAGVIASLMVLVLWFLVRRLRVRRAAAT